MACSLLLGASAYYLPGTYPREFSVAQHVQGVRSCSRAVPRAQSCLHVNLLAARPQEPGWDSS